MRENQEKTKEKQDVFVKLTAVQLAVCVSLGALFFFCYRRNGDYFRELLSSFSQLTESNFDFFSLLPFINDSTTSQTSQIVLQENTLGIGGEDINMEKNENGLSLEVYQTQGTAVYPVNGATVSSSFGERIHPIYGTNGFHSGIDLAVDEGTPVYAVLDARVMAVGVGENSGNYVKLKHENGMETLYCHLQKANVAENTVVRKGDVIGFVGQTGLATGPHLHFEVHINDVKYNPAYLLEDAVILS